MPTLTVYETLLFHVTLKLSGEVGVGCCVLFYFILFYFILFFFFSKSQLTKSKQTKIKEKEKEKGRFTPKSNGNDRRVRTRKVADVRGL